MGRPAIIAPGRFGESTQRGLSGLKIAETVQVPPEQMADPVASTESLPLGHPNSS